MATYATSRPDAIASIGILGIGVPSSQKGSRPHLYIVHYGNCSSSDGGRIQNLSYAQLSLLNHRQNLSRHYSQPVQVLSLSQLLCNSAPQDNGALYSFSSSLRGLSLLCQAAYYAPYLFMEIILFVLTFRRWFIMRKSHPVGVSIIHIFFRDGMIYFAVIFGAVSLLVCEPE